MKDVQGIRFTKDGLTFKASQIKRGMTFAKTDAIIKRNAQREQNTANSCQPLTRHPERPRQEATTEQQRYTDTSFSIPSLGLFDPTNPVYDPAEEELRRRMERKKKKRGPRL